MNRDTYRTHVEKVVSLVSVCAELSIDAQNVCYEYLENNVLWLSLATALAVCRSCS